MSRKVSNIARQILEYGLQNDPRKDLGIPPQFIPIANEIYDVPEKPEGFVPAYLMEDYQKKVILASGGLDSTVSWLMQKDETGETPEAYYVNMGQDYAEKELATLKQLGIEVKVITVKEPAHIHDNMWKHIHPGRNFYYLSLVAEQMIEPADLVLSAVDGEISQQGGDKSWAFLDLANAILTSQKIPTRVITPLSNMTKGDLVAWAIEHGHLETVKQTISCFAKTTGRCGECQSCLRTWLAFEYNNIEIPFDKHPMVGAKQYVDKYQMVMSKAIADEDYSHYSRRRISQDLAVIHKWTTTNA